MMIRKLCAAAAVVVFGTATSLAAPPVGTAAALRASYAALQPKLEQSPFGKPLHLVSSESRDRLKGDIHAVVEQPFEKVRSGLSGAQSWCDLLLLHPNVTNCRVNGKTIALSIGKQGTPAAFAFDVTASTADYLDVQLHADDGPIGTSDYRIDLEAAPLDERHTILHLVFSHAYGVQARLAMRAYLSTFGRGKVGFTVVGHDASGQPVYVDDFRGALERNAMRYYLCIEAYLDSLSAAPGQRFERRLQTWYAYTERYPLQLREEGDYLSLKRHLARSVN
jgi:hypothetical protein